MEILKNQQTRNLFATLLIFSGISLVNIHAHARIDLKNICRNMRRDIATNVFTPVREDSIAKALYAYDFTKDESIFGKNETTPEALASLAKLMTVRVALAHTSLGTVHTVTASDVKPDGASMFVPGDSFTVQDLLPAALIASSNNAALMIARSTDLSDKEFVASMNEEAASLGLASLSYQNPTGLENADDTASAFGNAKDVLTLLEKNALDFPEVFALGVEPQAMIRSSTGRKITLKNTNELTESLPSLIASKTGYTDVAGGNLAILWNDPKGTVLGAVVLGSTKKGRFDDMSLLHDATELYVTSINAFPGVCN